MAENDESEEYGANREAVVATYNMAMQACRLVRMSIPKTESIHLAYGLVELACVILQSDYTEKDTCLSDLGDMPLDALREVVYLIAERNGIRDRASHLDELQPSMN